MHPRHRLDLRPADVGRALTALVTARGRARSERAVLAVADAEVDGLVTSSVRAGWDLLLTTCAWPAGSEVLVSAITHPAMASLITQAGLVPVPVELDLETLLPDPATLAAATTGRTRAVLVVQLFGGRSDLSAVAGFCRERGLLLVEDAAQAWCGPATLRSAADVTLVSFGLIKTATAVGGAILRVSDLALLRRLRRTHLTWPVQTRIAYAGRLVRALALLLLSEPVVHGLLLRACGLAGIAVDRPLDRLTRSASTVDVDVRRRRPSSALLTTLARRLGPSDPSAGRVRTRTAAGESLRVDLAAGFPQPGGRAVRTHWLFPVRAADPAALVSRLRQVGVDASTGTSNLVALTTDGPAADLMRHVVYVPVYPELPEHVRAAVRRVLSSGPS